MTMKNNPSGYPKVSDYEVICLTEQGKEVRFDKSKLWYQPEWCSGDLNCWYPTRCGMSTRSIRDTRFNRHQHTNGTNIYAPMNENDCWILCYVLSGIFEEGRTHQIQSVKNALGL